MTRLVLQIWEGKKPLHPIISRAHAINMSDLCSCEPDLLVWPRCIRFLPRRVTPCYSRGNEHTFPNCTLCREVTKRSLRLYVDSCSFYWRILLETKIWVLGRCPSCCNTSFFHITAKTLFTLIYQCIFGSFKCVLSMVLNGECQTE